MTIVVLNFLGGLMKFKRDISYSIIIMSIFWGMLGFYNEFSTFQFWIGLIAIYIAYVLSDISQQIESLGRFFDASTIAGKWCSAKQKYERLE
jgi:hypothetical protein